ncbi:uncharacterized protein METZ01_LOCUS394394, partial [marine metagenome]
MEGSARTAFTLRTPMSDDLPESTDSVHFARYLSGEASDAERQQLEAWV